MKFILSNVKMTRLNKKMKTLSVSFIASSLLMLISTSASSQQVVNSTFSATPPSSARMDPPSVMLSLSRDHQYFFKAYNDYTDLNPEDGLNEVETSYEHLVDYFGYFDSSTCYDYDRVNGVFNPTSFVDDNQTFEPLFDADGNRVGPHVCSGNWNGNFLNWSSMTRMDIVRRIFFGGLRSTDPTDPDQPTILERAYLPSDAHSFAKYYNGRGGASIAQLTEFSNPPNNGDEVDDMGEGYTFCNTSYVPDGTGGANASQEVTAPPQMRSVQGNWQLWGSNERWQCTWADEETDALNSNTSDSGIFAENSDPDEEDDNGQEFIVRVSSCVEPFISLNEQQFCKRYPAGNNKPFGILQLYGDDGLIDFGLMTGSYDNNTNGGVLRKNTGTLADEVDVLNTGVFTFTETSDSIIKFLSLIRPWGYRLDNGTYISGNGGSTDVDNCRFQLTEIPFQANGSRCNSWGNPISEIYAETIRYMAGLTANPLFDADDTDFITGLNDTPWIDPLNIDENLCSDLNTIVVNASVSSFDDDNAMIVDIDGGINDTTIPITGNITDIWTDFVGASEVINENGDVINGSDFFVGIGSNGTASDEFCTSKRVDALSDAMGLCPEAPTVGGSFAMAGIALYAHNNDIRPDLPGNQTVNTFAISLATNVPVISVPVTGSDDVLEILPAYRLLEGVDGNNNPNGEGGGGALVDFRIVQPHTLVPGTTDRFTARYYVNWEDSEQGGDYDQDVWGIISYELNESANTIRIETEVFAQSTGGGQLFGFVTNGTSQDGFHAFSGILGATFPDALPGIPGCVNCRANSENIAGSQDGPQFHVFTLAPSAVNSLESPLFYAAKYGGFDENLNQGELISIDDRPDEESEFDTDGDGLPDDFFFVTNPGSLFDSLEEALENILSVDAAAGSAVANFASQNGFGNIVIQGIFQEAIDDDENDQVVWTGELFSFFIDDFGIFREDRNGNGTLDGYGIDTAFEYDSASEFAQIQRLTVQFDLVVDEVNPANSQEVPRFLDDGTLDATDIPGLLEPSELNTLWNASERLRLIDNDEIVINRPYLAALDDQTGNPDNAGGGARYIFTHIDANLNGEVDADEQHLLDAQLFDAGSGAGPNAIPFFAVGTENAAIDVINFTRGLESSNAGVSNFNEGLDFRNRSILQTVDAAGTQELQTFRLGDLVSSTPVTVAGPSEIYGSEGDGGFGDESYQGFQDFFENRRQVTYVGANDGLLHAFNNGFRDPSDITTRYTTTSEFNTNVIAQPLGTELWAYAPFNLLPHLQFLTLPNYLHNFYIDGSAQSFDVKIFDDAEGNCNLLNGSNVNTAACRYINGWGTILVAGMRQGGGDFPINDASGNAVQAPTDIPGTTENFVTRSSYIIVDVTNPELEPRILAEVNHPDLNFTTSGFDVFYTCGTGTLCTDTDLNNNFDGTWSLVFGSGPNDVSSFETNESAKVFSYNLDGESGVQVTEVIDPLDGGVAVNSFVGGVSARDWDNGELGFRNDDVAYFGTVQNTDTTDAAGITTLGDSGSVFRYFPDSIVSPLTNSRTNVLIDTQRPVFETPITLSRETLSNNVLASWVYIGTGIFLTRENADITDQERFMGIIEPFDENILDGLSAPVGTVSGFDTAFENSDVLTYDTVDIGNLQDVTDVDVLFGGFLNNDPNTPVRNSDGDIAVTGDFFNDLIVVNGPAASGDATVDSVGELSQHIVAETSGWFRDLPSNISVDPSSRLTGAPLPFLNALFFTTFEPQSQTGFGVCDGETGESQLFALDQTTGVASTFGSVGVDSASGIISFASVPFAGNASGPVAFSSEALGSNRGVIITLDDDSRAVRAEVNINDIEDARTGWREIN